MYVHSCKHSGEQDCRDFKSVSASKIERDRIYKVKAVQSCMNTFTPLCKYICKQLCFYFSRRCHGSFFFLVLTLKRLLKQLCKSGSRIYDYILFYYISCLNLCQDQNNSLCKHLHKFQLENGKDTIGWVIVGLYKDSSSPMENF